MRSITLLAILVCSANLTRAADPQATKSPEPWKTSYTSMRDRLESNNIAALMKDPGVLKELQFKDEQKKNFEALQVEFRKTGRSITDETGEGITDYQLQKLTWDSVKSVQNAERDNYMRVLTPAQRQRLQEIYIQIVGAFALEDQAIQDRLNIDPDRRLEIREIRDQYIKAKYPYYRQMEKLFLSKAPTDAQSGVRDHDKETIDKLSKEAVVMTKLRAEASARILRLLTRRQRDVFKKMQGKPYKGLVEMTVPGPAPRSKDETPPKPE